jgi:hypothetical protein
MVRSLSALLFSGLLLGNATFAEPQEPLNAHRLIEASIAYHDPSAQWFEGAWKLTFEESRPDGSGRETVVTIDNLHDRFEYRTQRDENIIEGSLPDGSGENCSFLVNGSSDIPAEQREKYRLTCDRAVWYRNYYSYLWGLPMKLQDPGTIIDPEIIEATYDDQAVLGLKATYDAAVGGDTWYFYLDPDTYALVGYRFYHDETANDGEYITVEDELSSGGLKLPKARAWFTHGDDKYLGTDTLISIERLASP